MSNQPVSLRVARPEKVSRIHVFIRLTLLLVLSAVGCSSAYWLLYLAIPALAALLIAEKRGERYLSEDAPHMVRALKWLAAAYAYLWLLTDTFPTTETETPVELELTPSGQPTPTSALLRLLYSLPALIVLALMSLVASALWVIGAVAILVVERVPGFVADFLTTTLRYQFRFFAYHLSLVDRYPSLEETGISHVPGPHTA
jgi:Domain of unknown function (DUF4389)